MEKQLRGEGSHYRIRKTYLETLKQFLADDLNVSRSQGNDDIEAYLLYEKQVSHYLQELLEQSAFKTIHN